MNICILGAGGHAKVIIDILHEMNKVKKTYDQLLIFDDDSTTFGKTILGHPIVGRISDAHMYSESEYVIAIGNNKIREKVSKDFEKRYIVIRHPKSIVANDVEIGEGTVIMAGAVINSGTYIGKHCIINTMASVDHDTKIQDYVHLSPGVHMGGGVGIGQRSWIGVGASIKNNVNIEADCVIGVGGVVIKDIVENGVYVGNPVRKIATRVQ